MRTMCTVQVVTEDVEWDRWLPRLTEIAEEVFQCYREDVRFTTTEEAFHAIVISPARTGTSSWPRFIVHFDPQADRWTDNRESIWAALSSNLTSR